eukprot:15464054-Alexandrium_andersonii.AAC.1
MKESKEDNNLALFGAAGAGVGSGRPARPTCVGAVAAILRTPSRCLGPWGAGAPLRSDRARAPSQERLS